MAMKLFIQDTETGDILAYESGTDLVTWTRSETIANNFHTETTEFTNQLNALNAIHPDRYIGAGGVGTPKP